MPHRRNRQQHGVDDQPELREDRDQPGHPQQTQQPADRAKPPLPAGTRPQPRPKSNTFQPPRKKAAGLGQCQDADGDLAHEDSLDDPVDRKQPAPTDCMMRGEVSSRG